MLSKIPVDLNKVKPDDLELEGQWTHPEHGRVDLVSINGIGEIRWDVRPTLLDFVGDAKGAVKFFGITPTEEINE